MYSSVFCRVDYITEEPLLQAQKAPRTAGRWSCAEEVEARDPKPPGDQVLPTDDEPVDPKITDDVVCTLDSVDMKAFTLP